MRMIFVLLVVLMTLFQTPAFAEERIQDGPLLGYTQLDAGRGSSPKIPTVCLHGTRWYYSGTTGILVQDFTVVENTITTYACINGNCYPTHNKVLASVPVKCTP